MNTFPPVYIWIQWNPACNWLFAIDWSKPICSHSGELDGKHFSISAWQDNTELNVCLNVFSRAKKCWYCRTLMTIWLIKSSPEELSVLDFHREKITFEQPLTINSRKIPDLWNPVIRKSQRTEWQRLLNGLWFDKQKRMWKICRKYQNDWKFASFALCFLSYLMTLILLILYNKKEIYKFNYPHLCLAESTKKNLFQVQFESEVQVNCTDLMM